MAQAVMMFVAAMDLDGSVPPTYSHQTDEGTTTWADSEALRELGRKQAIFPDVERIVERCGGERWVVERCFGERWRGEMRGEQR